MPSNDTLPLLRIESLCPEIDKAVIRDFLSRLDEDYFSTFSPEEIATHVRMSCELDKAHPVQARITSRGSHPDASFDVVIVGFDYLSAFSIFCGLLSAFGLDIRAGDIYSFNRKDSGRSGRRKVVDVFRVTLKPGEIFHESEQREFERELTTHARLLAEGAAAEARERLNRFLTERVERMDESLTGLLSPIELRFDNEASPEWTVMHASSEDAFAFLYAVSNALAMRGVYIHRVKIRSAGRRAVDEFFISDRSGRKINDPREQERLRTAVAMMKQFTSFLPEAPDPAKAMGHFDQFLDKIAQEPFPDRLIAFLADRGGMKLLGRLLGSSDFLWDDFLSIRFHELLPVLEDLAAGAVSQASRADVLRSELRAEMIAPGLGFDEKKQALNRFKDRELFLIDVRRLVSPQETLMDFSESVTRLAEVVIGEAAAVCYDRLVEQRGLPVRDDGTPGVYAVFGLGKFGGREMGYASDLELLFVHDGPQDFFESLARDAAHFIEARRKGIFDVDLRLRPYGDAGSWATSWDEFRKYYSPAGQAAPFERQALIKLRWVAGDESLGRRVEAHRDSFTYSDAPWDWENALHLRMRQTRELVRPGLVNVKYSAGGIVDIEYAVQYLQLLNGYQHPDVRVPGTLDALDRLRRLQIVREPDYRMLRGAYLFLRNLIDALRIVRGDASDLMLPEEASDEFKALARRLGYRDKDRKQAAARLAADIRERMKEVHDYFITRFSRHSG